MALNIQAAVCQRNLKSTDATACIAILKSRLPTAWFFSVRGAVPNGLIEEVTVMR